MTDEYEPVTFTSLIDKPRGGKMRLEGCFAGSVIEEIGVGIRFSITPRLNDTAPMVDGKPKILVILNRPLVDIECILLASASVNRVGVTIDGDYIPRPRGDYISDIFADRIEFYKQ